MALASVLGRIFCSIRTVVPPVRGATSAAEGICSAAGLKKAPVLSSTVSLRCSSCLIPSPRLLSPLPALCRCSMHDRRWNSTKPATGVLEQVNTEIESQSPSGVFAVVHISGRQFKITSNDLIVVNRIEADIGEQIYLEKFVEELQAKRREAARKMVLLAGSDNFTLIGTPLMSKDLVRVKATVTEHSRTAKVIVFKKKRRKNYKRKKGHRQDITILRINSIELSPNLK